MLKQYKIYIFNNVVYVFIFLFDSYYKAIVLRSYFDLFSVKM